MVDVINLQIRIRLIDQLAEGCAFFIQRKICEFGERGVEGAQIVACGLRARKLFLVQSQRTVFAVNRHQRFVEMAVFNGVFSALLADIGQIVNRFAVNAFQRCNGVGAYALMRLWVLGAQARIAIVEERRSFEPFGAVKRHHFGAAGNAHIFHARHNIRRGDIDRGNAGAAETVERHRAGFHIISCIKRRHTAQIAALYAALTAGAPNNVTNFCRVEIIALSQCFQHCGTQMLRVNVGQCALARFANAARCAAGIDNPCFVHG